jgi:hypothetical protein
MVGYLLQNTFHTCRYEINGIELVRRKPSEDEFQTPIWSPIVFYAIELLLPPIPVLFLGFD